MLQDPPLAASAQNDRRVPQLRSIGVAVHETRRRCLDLESRSSHRDQWISRSTACCLLAWTFSSASLRLNSFCNTSFLQRISGSILLVPALLCRLSVYPLSSGDGIVSRGIDSERVVNTLLIVHILGPLLFISEFTFAHLRILILLNISFDFRHFYWQGSFLSYICHRSKKKKLKQLSIIFIETLPSFLWYLNTYTRMNSLKICVSEFNIGHFSSLINK